MANYVPKYLKLLSIVKLKKQKQTIPLLLFAGPGTTPLLKNYTNRALRNNYK